jgi:voltage-dependent potassium channel beta subunit
VQPKGRDWPLDATPSVDEIADCEATFRKESSMEYRRLGKSGLKVSALSFGSWVTFSNQLGTGDALACMVAAYDAGCNFFDNAEVYAHGKSELLMGEALAKAGWRRDSYLVSSKVMMGSVPRPLPTQQGLSRKHVFDACHQALERLKVDYLDLFFCHRPDPTTPIEETVRAMSDLVTQGKVLYWGTSEWSAQELTEAYAVARELRLVPPTMEQPQYNMLHRDRVELEYARLYDLMGLGTTIWSPLSSGLLTGKYNDGIPADSRANVRGYEWLRQILESPASQGKIPVIKELSGVAKELGVSMSRLAIAWCLKSPHVSTVITGASRVEQVRENMRALEVLPLLTTDVMERLEKILRNKPQPPPAF